MVERGIDFAKLDNGSILMRIIGLPTKVVAPIPDRIDVEIEISKDQQKEFHDRFVLLMDLDPR